MNGIMDFAKRCILFLPTTSAHSPRSNTTGIILSLLYVLVQSCLAQTNCTRIFHSAIIHDQTLFIDGGEMHTIWPNQTITTKAIRDLETVDLSRSWVNSDTDLFTYIPKPWNASDPNIYPPFLNEGASWSDSENLYFYGGSISFWDGPPTPPPLATWMYNVAANNWTSNGFWGVPLVRLAQGGVVQSSVTNKAYYLSGTLSPNGNPTFYQTPGADTYESPGLISLDMGTLEWTNSSTADINTWGTVGDGYLSMIESVGEQGLLVSFGGYTYPVGEKLSFLSSRQTNDTNKNSMEYVRVYDIANDKWFTQQTTGDIPSWRMSGCTVVAAAQDLSSFSIYVFGGMGTTTEESDGNIYVLSLPSFRWIQVYQDTAIRIKHKCQLAQRHTMLVVGGIIPTDGNEYYPEAQNCDSATFANGLGIFDLRTLSWMSNYNASDNGEYTVPSAISNVIGGGATGSANLTEPEGGFNSTDLGTLFKTRNLKATSSTGNSSNTLTSISSSLSLTSTSAPGATDSSLSRGVIAAVALGSVAGAVSVFALVFVFIARQRRESRQYVPAHIETPLKSRGVFQGYPGELEGDHTPPVYEMGDVLPELGDGSELPEMPTESNHRGMI